MSFSTEGPFLSYFYRQRQPLLQYDLDVLPEYRSLDKGQRDWLSNLEAAVYSPIFTDESLIGMLAIGPMISGVPYRTNELKMLQVLAGQTVAALTNARLFDDMKNLNVEIQDLNEDLRSSNERLQNMDEVKTDFITIASHELRTPLTQIKGYIDILDAMVEDGTLSSDEGQELIGRIGRATDQLEKVISAMLDVSQIDVDAMALNLTEVRLDSVLRIALEPLVEAIRERRLALTVRGFRDLPAIEGDFQRLVQVVSNLASNAVKYTPDGGKITIGAEVIKDQQGDSIEIELVFKDTGVGVNPQDHELIFDKFFRTYDPKMHSTGSTKFQGAGPGLGLSIVRGIVEAHGGRIWLESAGHDPESCPGSEFHVILPLKAPELTPEPADN
jgi:signal transduction histidine kinase